MRWTVAVRMVARKNFVGVASYRHAFASISQSGTAAKLRNAGIMIDGDYAILEVSDDTFRKTIEINALGALENYST